MAKWRTTNEVDRVSNISQTGVYMKDTGKKTNLQGREESFTLMDSTMRENGCRAKSMGRVSIINLMDLFVKDNGKMINLKDMLTNNMLILPAILDSI